jgi:hypothetical protein
MNRAGPSRACRGQCNGSVAHTTEYFLGGARAIRTYAGRHWEVLCCTTAHQSPNGSFSLGPTVLNPNRSIDTLRLLPRSCFVLSTYHSSFSFTLVVSWHHYHSIWKFTSDRGNVTVYLTVVLGFVDHLSFIERRDVRGQIELHW